MHYHVQTYIQHLYNLHCTRTQCLLMRIKEDKNQVHHVSKEEQHLIDIEGVLYTAIDKAGCVNKVHIWETALLRNGDHRTQVLHKSLSKLLNSAKLGEVTKRCFTLQRRNLLCTGSHESESTAFNSSSSR